MSHHQFILLQCVYIVIVLSGLAAEKFVSLPEHVAKAKPNRKEILSRKSKLYLTSFLFTQAVVLGCGLVGFVGMFFLWRYSPWLFVIGIAGKALLHPMLTWKVRNGLDAMLGDIELFLDGVIIILVFVGPANHLFFSR